MSDMLQIAMAEDGAEDDEIKEDYAKRADETLASMRAKLEEARRNEGKAPIEISSKGSVPAVDATSSNVKGEENLRQPSYESPTTYKAELDIARSKVSTASWYC